MNEKPCAFILRNESPNLIILDLNGFLSNQCEKLLEDIFARIKEDEDKRVVLNFYTLEGMDASGLMHLTIFLTKIKRTKRIIQGYGLDKSFHNIFDLTRLNEIIQLFADATGDLEGSIGKG